MQQWLRNTPKAQNENCSAVNLRDASLVCINSLRCNRSTCEILGTQHVNTYKSFVGSIKLTTEQCEANEL